MHWSSSQVSNFSNLHTHSLATNLYSKETRFVFELIQNAEDNNYSKATAKGNVPSITFRLNSESIIIDSNEDGFTDRNVRAICSTGESTKTSATGYIGEKGIGFKSVFKVASRVKIQSGPFSFFFDHNRDDGGLGMVTPHYVEHEELPQGVTTRMTLSLNPPSSFTQRRQDFADLPDTLGVFLKKLKTVCIDIDAPSGSRSQSTYSYSYDSRTRRGKLAKLVGLSGGSPQASTQYFRVTQRQVRDLPEDPDRPNTRQADVVLAFPVNERSSPVIDQQHVFAYLPLRKFGFNVRPYWFHLEDDS